MKRLPFMLLVAWVLLTEQDGKPLFVNRDQVLAMRQLPQGTQLLVNVSTPQGHPASLVVKEPPELIMKAPVIGDAR